MSRTPLRLLLLAPLALAACDGGPDLSSRVTPLPANAQWPELMPADDLGLTETTQSDVDRGTAEADELAARAAALRARARDLANTPI
ncbi:hypothetical protein [Celeribacter arenosi]